MERKINRRLFFMGFLSMILTTVLLVVLFHGTIERSSQQEVKKMASFLAKACPSAEDVAELMRFEDEDKRLTLIASDGTVLYDSFVDASQMENHKNRREVMEAMEIGVGESSRESITLNHYSYYYALRLPDDSVLRVGSEVEGLLDGFWDTLPALLLVLCCVILLGLLVSRLLTKKLVAQLQEMIWHMDGQQEQVPKEMLPLAQAMKAYQQKKEEGEKWRQQFTANVSHELKTPLTSISGYAEMIESGMVQEGDIKTFAGKIHREAGRLIMLINDILELSKLDEPGELGPVEQVDLLRLARDTVEMLSMKAEQYQVQLRLGGNGAHVWGNKTMLGEVLYNLCDNAIRYNKAGGFVQVDVSTVDDQPILVVKDNGIGIPLEKQDRIFERFYRVDNSRSKATGGTGLGLAIVKHIVLRHNGTIELESKAGGPTKMKVVFPPQTEEKERLDLAAAEKKKQAELEEKKEGTA